jgi:hypothetical protein
LELVNKEGGEIPVYFPKYQKQEHPKGWKQDEQSNDDLPW